MVCILFRKSNVLAQVSNSSAVGVLALYGADHLTYIILVRQRADQFIVTILVKVVGFRALLRFQEAGSRHCLD